MDTMFVENIYEFEEDGKSGKPGTKFKSVQIIENKKYTNECTDNWIWLPLTKWFFILKQMKELALPGISYPEKAIIQDKS